MMVVRLLVEAEREVKSNFKSALWRLETVAILMAKYVNREEEKMLFINTIFWINEIMLEAGEGRHKVEEVLALIDGHKYDNQYEYL